MPPRYSAIGKKRPRAEAVGMPGAAAEALVEGMAGPGRVALLLESGQNVAKDGGHVCWGAHFDH